MWLTRRNSISRASNTPTKASSNYSFPTFKDIQTLCSSDPQIHKKPSNIFHRVRLANSLLRALSPQPIPETENDPGSQNGSDQTEPSISIRGAENLIVVYFTSLRVVRSTFEDCKTVRSILRGFHVKIDERDLSMDYSFMDELQMIMGGGQCCEKTKMSLPRVFIGGKYVGGAEEISKLHETGELKKMVERLPAAVSGTCEACGGFRFILCDECTGSHKCYSEKGGFRSCTVCNVNGLIRCASCFIAPL